MFHATETLLCLYSRTYDGIGITTIHRYPSKTFRTARCQNELLMIPAQDALIDNLVQLWTGRGINQLNGDGKSTLLELLHKENEKQAIVCLGHSQFQPFCVTHTRSGCTALGYCAWYGFEECAKVLISRGAHVNEKETVDYRGWTALHNACIRSRPSMVRLLLDNNANVYAVTCETKSLAIHRAVRSEEIVAMLLDAGSPVNQQDYRGWTPLHHASYEGILSVIKLLVDQGADPSIRDYQGKTPMEVTMSTQISDYLQSRLKTL